MLTFPDIDPVAIAIGPIKVHWYGLMYLIGFAGAWWLGVVRAKQPNFGWTSDQVGDLIFYGAMGVVIGGRLGYMLFYNPFLPEGQASEFWEVWKGGMSFHGGFLGVLVAMWLFGRKYKKTFFQVTDFIAPFVPVGLGAGRIGNFINGELWGRVTDVPWGMVFPYAGLDPRHPSQLYEFALEGVLFFLILWVFSRKPRPLMAVSALFLIGYGCFRSFVEFFRQPDEALGFIGFDWLTMGQLLSFPMVIVGIGMMWLAYKRARNAA